MTGRRFRAEDLDNLEQTFRAAHELNLYYCHTTDITLSQPDYSAVPAD